MPDIYHIKDWKKALFFSLISYSMLLFVIIGINVFWKKDLDFAEVAFIAGAYMGSVTIFMLIAIAVFRKQ